MNRWQEFNVPRSAPNFYLPNVLKQKTVSLYDLEEYNKIILAFLPGIWAPWCRRFLEELSINSKFYNDTDTYFVTIISQESIQLKDYLSQNKINIDVLADENGATGTRYGVFDEKQTEPMRISKPTVFLLNSNKEICFKFIGNHLSDRPRFSEIIQMCAELDYNYNSSPKHITVPTFKEISAKKGREFLYHKF